MKFIMSYSCGKDSTLALHHMIAQGNEPVALLTMVNQDADRSFFHGADYPMLRAYSDALGIPFLPVPAAGENYHLAMERSLKEAAALGAEAACFGDIDIEGSRAWCEARCRNAGLKAVFPLWHRDRGENVRQLVALGYQCLIKSINNTLLPKSLLAGSLTRRSLLLCVTAASISAARTANIIRWSWTGRYSTGRLPIRPAEFWISATIP